MWSMSLLILVVAAEAAAQSTIPIGVSTGSPRAFPAVSIDSIFWNQRENARRTGIADEWIVLRSEASVDLNGWQIAEGDKRLLPIPVARLDGVLVVQSRLPFGARRGDTVGLGSRSWIWNDAIPDTARLIDPSGRIVSERTYHR
jgi:hypothetical protein